MSLSSFFSMVSLLELPTGPNACELRIVHGSRGELTAYLLPQLTNEAIPQLLQLLGIAVIGIFSYA